MKNELGRKITSLTIMTIMVAGGLTFAVPGMMPGAEADHTQYLFVSAENAEFANTFGGAQVVEIVVRDPLNASTEDGIPGAPKVEINGDKFAMVQGADGSWYGYTANGSSVDTADALGSDYGLEYGTECTGGSSGNAVTATSAADTSIFDDVDAVWVSHDECDVSGSAVTTVLGGAQGLSLLSSSNAGQFGIDADTDTSELTWPWISTYDFTAGPVEVCYLKSGAPECVMLDYDDTDSFNSHSTDRSVYPPGAQVELEIRDMMLNIDPTAVDDWSFDVGDESDANEVYTTKYSVYRASASSAASHAAITMSDIGFSDGGVLKLKFDGGLVLDLQDNADSTLVEDQVSIIETSTNTGVFTNIDDADVSNIFLKTTAPRGTSATIDYNDSAMSILVGYQTAVVDLDEASVGEEWNSGESFPIIFTDQDRNLNNTADEDILFSEEDTWFPTVHVGTPLGLFGTVKVSIAGGTTVTATSDSSSGVATVSAITAGGTETRGLEIDTGISVNDFRNMATGLDSDGDGELNDEAAIENTAASNGSQDRGDMVINYDVTGLAVNTTNVDISIEDTNGGGNLDIIADKTLTGSFSIMDEFDGTTAADITDFDNDNIVVKFYPIEGSLADIATATAFYVDFFTFHSSGVNNAVYRCQCEEGDPGVFEGDVEYYMINQNEADAYADWPSRTHLSDSLTMIMTGDLTGVDAPRIQVNDTDSDGVSTPQADQVDALTHSGTASFDADSYKVADTVTVTITDMDLNTDSELIEIYKVHTTDKVGDIDGHNVAAGSSFSHIMDITFDYPRKI